MSGWWIIETLVRDVRYGVRSLRRDAAFSLIAVLTLAFTLGAVGATPAEVSGAIIREGMWIVLIGVGVGLGIALASARLLGHMLYGSASGDMLFHVAAGLLVIGVGLIACWIPARRAAGVDPMAALRVD